MISYDPTKPKLAVLVSRFPFPLEKGDKLRAYYQIKELSITYNISLFALTDHAVSQADKDQLSQFCFQIQVYRLSYWMILLQLFNSLVSNKPFQVGYFYDPRIKRKIRKAINELKPDHIYCQLIRTSEYVKDDHLCSKTLDYMDALSKGMERRIEKSSFFLRPFVRSEARRLSQYERIIFSYFEFKTIISEQDRDLIMHPERSSIQCIPNGIDKYFFEKMDIVPEYDIVFIGNMSYIPNVEAVEFIGQLLHQKPELTCLIAGANPAATVKKIAEHTKQIRLLAWVEDIRSAYCNGEIFVAPMMIGTGMQNKLLEAMALGIPCITTSLANNAIKARHNESILVADNMQEFIDSIEYLKKNPSIAQQIGEEGKIFVQKNYSWKQSIDRLKEQWR